MHLEVAHLIGDSASALVVPELPAADCLEHVPPYLHLRVHVILVLPVLPIYMVLVTISVIEAPDEKLVFLAEINHAAALGHCKVQDALQQKFEDEALLFDHLETHHLHRWLVQEAHECQFHVPRMEAIVHLLQQYYTTVLLLSFKQYLPVMLHRHLAKHLRVDHIAGL